ncbi:unnamed protein product, partial [Ectocarpus sp. 12 AP-2014]
MPMPPLHGKKRPRLDRQHQHQHQHHQNHDQPLPNWRGPGGGSPWQWRAGERNRDIDGSRGGTSSSTTNRPMTGRPENAAIAAPTCSYEREDSDSDDDETLPPQQLFDGPLLSVKEYRDRPTGDVRLAVFQGGRRMSVAQILFSLKQEGRGENNHAYGHVKSVKVDQDFRGIGLGPLLFKEVFATLGNLSVTEVRLEAEEDMGKYNHLVRYYEDLGFKQLEGSKVRYVHHCDQVYRKIPMIRPVSARAQPRSRRSPRLVDNGGWFLVVRLQTKAGSFVRSTADGDVVSPGAPNNASATTTTTTTTAAHAADGD